MTRAEGEYRPKLKEEPPMPGYKMDTRDGVTFSKDGEEISFRHESKNGRVEIKYADGVNSDISYGSLSLDEIEYALAVLKSGAEGLKAVKNKQGASFNRSDEPVISVTLRPFTARFREDGVVGFALKEDGELTLSRVLIGKNDVARRRYNPLSLGGIQTLETVVDQLKPKQ